MRREAPPESGIFFRLQVYERVGILHVEVYERVRKICHLGLWKGPKGQTDEFYGPYKVGKTLY